VELTQTSMGDVFEFAIPCHPFNPQIRHLLNMALSEFSLRLSQAASKSSWVRRVLAIFGIGELSSAQQALGQLN